MRDYHPVPSNWRSSKSLGAYLEDAAIPALYGVDTRALVLHLRETGALRGVVRTVPDDHKDSLDLSGTEAALAVDHPLKGTVAEWAQEAADIPSMAGSDLAGGVTTREIWTEGPHDASYHVVVMDFGVKRNIVRQLVQLGARCTVVPATTSSEDILALQPDGVLLSNGPGDPEPVVYAVETIRALLGGSHLRNLPRSPTPGDCLRGTDVQTPLRSPRWKSPGERTGGGNIEITAQNHSFALDPSSLNGREIAVTHMNLNDDTVAGIRHKRFPAFSVQFHPEASPGPTIAITCFPDLSDSWRVSDERTWKEDSRSWKWPDCDRSGV